MKRPAGRSRCLLLPVVFLLPPLLAGAVAAGCGSDGSKGGQESGDGGGQWAADASRTSGAPPAGGAQQPAGGAAGGRPIDAGDDARAGNARDAERVADAGPVSDRDTVPSDSGAADAASVEACEAYEGSLSISTAAGAEEFCRDYCSVNGDLTITGEELTNLDELHCLRRVTRALRIAASSLVDAELPNLISVGSLSEGDADNLQVLSLPSLQRIDEYMILDDARVLQTLALDSLEHVGTDIEISYLYEIEAIAIPLLETVGGTIEVNSTGILSELSLPSLVSIGGSLYLQGGVLQKASLPSASGVSGDLDLREADGLVEFTAPQLQTVGGFVELPPGESLTILILDSLEQIGRHLEAEGLRSLEHLYLPSLKTVNNHMYLGQNQSLESIDLSGLVDPSENYIRIYIEDNPSLEEIDLSALSELDGTLRMSGNGSLKRVELGNLKSATVVSGSFPATFENIDLHSLTTIGQILTLRLGTQTELDLSQLAETGETTINSDYLERVDLSSLVSATKSTSGGLHFDCHSSNGIDVVAPVLSSVDGSVWLFGSAFREVSLPALVSVSDDMSLAWTAVQTLELGALESAGGLLAEGNSSLTSIRAPRLRSITRSGSRMGLRILGNPNLETVSLPELVSVTHVRFENGPSLGALLLPKLERTRELFFDNTGLTSVSMPSVQTTDGNIEFQNNSSLTAISFPQMLDSNRPDWMAFQVMPVLTTIDMGNLSTAYSVLLFDLDSMTNVDGFANLTELRDWLRIRGNALLDDVTGLHNLASVDELTITDNPNLSSQAVDDLMDAIGTENISGTITVSGNGP